MTTNFRPMLSGKVRDVHDLTYPLLASPKLDGIRCLRVGGRLLSRSLKPIPNRYITRCVLSGLLPEGADGELMAGSTFQDCTSAVMSRDGSPNFTFHWFDVACSSPYADRVKLLRDLPPFVKAVVPALINTAEDLLRYESEQLALGHEGVMVRAPGGPYKCGRSTEKEGFLLKLKRFVDSEATVIGFEELQRNHNPARVNEIGLSSRSRAVSEMEPAGTLGALLVRDGDAEFRIGTGVGLTTALRDRVWSQRRHFLGAIVKYRYQPHGTKGAPRIPVFLGFRDERDMDEVSK